MSFQLVVEIEGLDKEKAISIINACKIEDAFNIHKIEYKKWFQTQKIDLLILVDEVLSEQADWNAEYWDMNQKELKKLIRTLELIKMNTFKGFKFKAVWSGEKNLVKKI